MRDDPSADDEYWQTVRDADGDAPAGAGDSTMKTDPDAVRDWAEERDAVPVSDPDTAGPSAYALRHENAIDGGAHERVSWEDFVASFRDENMALRHPSEDDGTGAHRFVDRSEVESHPGDERTPADRDSADIAEGERRSDSTGTGTMHDPDRPLGNVEGGATVVDDRDERVGIVTAVEGNTVYVDPDPGLTQKLSAKLGWADREDAEYTIDASHVESVEDGDVRVDTTTI